MTDTRLTPNTGTLEITGNEAKLTVTRVAETWQFFAFVFAALILPRTMESLKRKPRKAAAHA